MSAPSRLRAAILIISETANKDPTTDKGIAALQEVFSRIAGDRWDANETRIVPDNAHDIQSSIKGWCDGTDPINLIATSGGTGFAQKDVTPEVSVLLALPLLRCSYTTRRQHWRTDGNWSLGSDTADPQACPRPHVSMRLLHFLQPSLMLGIRHAMLSTSLKVTPCGSGGKRFH